MEISDVSVKCKYDTLHDWNAIRMKRRFGLLGVNSNYPKNKGENKKGIFSIQTFDLVGVL